MHAVEEQGSDANRGEHLPDVDFSVIWDGVAKAAGLTLDAESGPR